MSTTSSHPTSLRYILILSSQFQFQNLVYPSLLMSCQRFRLIPRICVTFRSMLKSSGERLLASDPNTKLEDHPLSTDRDCLLSISATTLHIWRPHPKPENVPCYGDRDPLNMVLIPTYSQLPSRPSPASATCGRSML